MRARCKLLSQVAPFVEMYSVELVKVRFQRKELLLYELHRVAAARRLITNCFCIAATAAAAACAGGVDGGVGGGGGGGSRRGEMEGSGECAETGKSRKHAHNVEDIG